jgi:hypothetical protein
MLRFLRVTVLSGLVGCAAAVPSAPEARVPTPGTVTKDNPAGDAESPVDAALQRLLHEPIGAKDDRYRTLRPRLPDADNWKRVRFFGYPTRAGFRYGTDHYALALIDYSEAEDDAPRACLERFMARAQQAADVFDLEVGPLQREVRTHARGVESVDWVKWEAEEQVRRKELAEKRKRMREERKKRAEERRRRREELKRQAGNTPAKVSKPAASSSKPAAAPEAELGSRLRAIGNRLLRGVAAPTPNDTPDEGNVATKPTVPSEVQPKAQAGSGVRRLFGARARRSPLAGLEAADMPVLRTSGAFNTLFNDDRYLAAIVAYDSWPGTCLVHGFAVRVGSDETLAQAVLDRWIAEAAPQLMWRGSLRARPEIENR